MSSCIHEKIYSPVVLTSYTAKCNWVCKKCGERGTDTIGTYIDPNEFNDIVKGFEKEKKDE